MDTLTRLIAAITSSTESEPRPYECETCGVCFELHRQVCPECGGYTLVRTDWSHHEC